MGISMWADHALSAARAQAKANGSVAMQDRDNAILRV
jgi:hypothetical protein